MKKLIACMIITGFIACQSEKKTDESADSAASAASVVPDSLTFRYDSVKVYSKTPLSRDKRVTDTAKALIFYPVFTDSLVNRFVEKNVMNSGISVFNSVTGKDHNFKTYHEMAAGFIKGYDDYQKENDDAFQTWFLELKVKVLLQRKDYLAMECSHIDYLGGAHPNSVYSYLNYNPVTHQPISLDSLIKPGTMPALKAVAERIFRKNEKLSPTQSLANNYFFENNVFSLTQNFTITEKGLKFLYNPYEIKAYVYGTTELIVPFEELHDIQKPNTILAAFE